MSEAASYLGKDLVGLEDLTAEQILSILDTAEPFKEISERRIKKVPVLRGKTIVNLFFEASTRTRVSFEFLDRPSPRARRSSIRRAISKPCASTWW